MTEKELFDEYQSSDCSIYKDFIDFLLNKLNVLNNYNKKLLQSDIDKHNKIALLSQKVNDLQKENAKVEEIKANADYQLEGRDLEIKELKEKLKELKSYRCINHYNVSEKESSNAVVCYKMYDCNNCEYFKEMKREI